MNGQAKLMRIAEAAPEERRGDVVPFPRARNFGKAKPREPFSLVVDLASEPLGWRWFRGAATLALLCGCTLATAPGVDLRAFASPAPAVQPGQTLHHAALGADALAVPEIPAEPDTIPKPRGLATGERDGLRRVTGDVTDGLYWSLRGAGAAPEIAAAYLQVLATRIDVGEVAPFDRFDFVVDSKSGTLVYAALDRAWSDDAAIVRWPAAGSQWQDADPSPERPAAAGLMSPVAGRITSRFGSRTHPIFRYTRFHSGIDFGAGWGTPIVAAADGQVAGVGWNGGYGRQVVIAHGGGIATTYSHMSSFAAEPGTPVRQGQVIGYVGSSGLSTGPHLHFEVRVRGRAVDPLSVQLASRPAVSREQLVAIKARVKALTNIPLAKG